jgi:hypothetical protein
MITESHAHILLIKALVYSNLAEANADLQCIESSTKALIFLGTPHRGSSYAEWGKIAAAIATVAQFDVNSRNIKALQPHGQPLAELEKGFGRLIMHNSFRIHNFQEAQGLKGVNYLNQRVGDLKMAAIFLTDLVPQVVEPWSASIGDPGKERTESINANHMDMCRYCGIDDPGYIKTGSEIASHVEELRKEMSGMHMSSGMEFPRETGANHRIQRNLLESTMVSGATGLQFHKAD